MSYTPKYTSEALVEAITQVDITETTSPNSSQVLTWIEEVEKEVEERRLGSHTAADVYIDVPSLEEASGYYNVTYRARTGQLFVITSMGVGRLVPLTNIKGPIISITSLYKNDKDPSQEPDWVELKEGPGSGTHFLLLESVSKGKTFGYALWIYDKMPLPGPKRLKMSYTYGYNINEKILQEWCTLKVAVKVLQAKMGTSSGEGLTEFVGGDLGTYIPTQYQARINMFRQRIAEIEASYFPHELAIAILS